MKTLNKTVLALLATSVMTTGAFADSGEGATDRIQSARGSVEALTVTLENMGAEVDSNVNLNGAYTADQKVSLYNAKHTELQNRFDTLHAQVTE